MTQFDNKISNLEELNKLEIDILSSLKNKNPNIFTIYNKINTKNFLDCLINLEKKKFISKKKHYKNKKYEFKDSENLIRPVTFLNNQKTKEEILNKELNGNLNKLSINNFNKINDKIIDSYKNNKDIFDFNKFIENLFDKSVMQPIYCPIYVNLLINIDKEDNNKILKKLLITKCNEFKDMIKGFIDKEDDLLDVSNYDDFCHKNKKKIFKKGFSQFIGELYKKQFITYEFIIEFISELINNILFNLENNNKNVENSTICLIQIINTVFNRNDFKKHKLCEEIVKIKNYKILPKKIKFSFMDLLEK